MRGDMARKETKQVIAYQPCGKWGPTYYGKGDVVSFEKEEDSGNLKVRMNWIAKREAPLWRRIVYKLLHRTLDLSVTAKRFYSAPP